MTKKRASRKARLLLFALGALLVMSSAGVVFALGATTPRATWFGPLTFHGDRRQDMVALTFDDGPDPPYTLQVKDVLDRYAVKGTFFSVAKAVAERPDVSKALIADGHLVANHSYHHDSTSWLDPRYPELTHAEDVIYQQLGVCPAFYRPPHGTHTPFMSWKARHAGMRLVNWEVSAGDWATNDDALVAQRVLDKVRPGSIILLHDGLDGKIGADRSVIVRALPAIIQGLQARGLQPVTLDKLLGTPGYLSSC